MKRTLTLAIGLLLVAGAAFGGWLAGSRIKSPAQIAAEAEPPEPSLITVPVERMLITTDVITRGNVRFDEPESVFAEPPAVFGVAPVITRIPQQGAEFAEGDLLYEVAGRPIFALRGELPLFRTLTVGAEGEDVIEFQEALIRLGYQPGEPDGVYGRDTEEAVLAFYEDRGYEAIGATPEEEGQLELAESAADQAQEALDLAARQRTASIEAQTALDSARTAALSADAAATLAQGRLTSAQSGIHPDTGLPPTPAELTALQAEADGAATAAASASAALAAAEAQASIAGPAIDLTVQRNARDRANEELEKVKADIGFKVPTSEIRFFAAFPIRVDSVVWKRGDLAQGEVMTVSGARLAIDSSIDVEQADAVTVGDAVTIDLTRRGISLTGKVSFKADRPGTNGVDGQEVYIEVLPDEIREDLTGANVRITIPVESTDGEVLAVPLAALSATAGGDTIVTVEDPDGSTRRIVVTAGLAAGGMVEVTPVDGDLQEGDRAVVGVQ